MSVDAGHPGRAIARRAACTLAIALALLGLGAATPARADGQAIVQDALCSSADNRIYFALNPSAYDQYFWYRIWRFDPVGRQWYHLYDAPSYYLQPSVNTVGTIGGGGGPGTIRGGFLTYVSIRDAGWYYVAAWIVFGSGATVAGYRYEYVGDYSNSTSGLVDRRACYIE